MKDGIFQTLWDFVERVITPPSQHSAPPASTLPAAAPVASRSVAQPKAPAKRPFRPVRVVPTVSIPDLPTESSAQDHYDHVTRLMLARYNIKVRKWRKSSSGVAYELLYRDGTIKRLIESPYPRGPMSMAIFLHEIGHHAIGFHVYKPRCLEEFHAWAFAIAAMEEHGLNITDAVRRRMHRSLHYAVSKATRRGLKSLPPELVPYLQDAPKRAA
jgi:hypothetical protein